MRFSCTFYAFFMQLTQNYILFWHPRSSAQRNDVQEIIIIEIRSTRKRVLKSRFKYTPLLKSALIVD